MRFYYPIFSKDIQKFVNRRVALIGKVIETFQKEKYSDFILVDPFGKVLIRSFTKKVPDLFSTVLVLGRCTSFSNRVYIIEDKIIQLNIDEEIFWRKNHLNKYKYITVREKKNAKSEYNKLVDKNQEKHKLSPSTKEQKQEDISIRPSKNLRVAILNIIEKLDRGEGVSIEDISKHLEDVDISTIQRIIEELLAIGELYEISPGKLKILK